MIPNRYRLDSPAVITGNQLDPLEEIKLDLQRIVDVPVDSPALATMNFRFDMNRARYRDDGPSLAHVLADPDHIVRSQPGPMAPVFPDRVGGRGNCQLEADIIAAPPCLWRGNGGQSVRIQGACQGWPALFSIAAWP